MHLELRKFVLYILCRLCQCFGCGNIFLMFTYYGLIVNICYYIDGVVKNILFF